MFTGIFSIKDKSFNNILKLLTWNNQAFPIGSYSFSSGLEYAVESNLITTGDELQSWLKNLLNFGSLQTDAILLVEAWKLMRKKKHRNLIELNNFAISLNQSYEKYIENIYPKNTLLVSIILICGILI